MGSNDPNLAANPTLIQKGDPNRSPLFLIHAAGGGILDYFKLQDLGRPVYGIRNPWFDSETKWKGGIQTLVDEYVGVICATVAPTMRGSRMREILVGGWSVGGQLALEVARVINSDDNPSAADRNKRRRPKIQVTGLVMIDTLYPYWGPPDTVHAEMPVDILVGSSAGGDSDTEAEARNKILRMMDWMNKDSLAWGLQNSKSNLLLRPDKADEDQQQPPPAVLLYATKYIPIASVSVSGNSSTTNADDICSSRLEENSGRPPRVMTDFLRHDRTLGWDSLFACGGGAGHGFIVANWQVDGHHFELFQKHLIKDTSDKVRKACDLLAED
ncbi:Alpha/Beta hydrolase protein [Rhypophila decipiens]|uniref:Alpha/Beta hydrolase protein n=1 Tax=Rhypophila decipiens TaxID=261697 RepID=A0AAN6Y8B3_9PEZI|nr:Alpha/Beta hydrolase protein [Rhypophila decipiens]